VFAGALETLPSLSGHCAHASCGVLAGRPEGIAQGTDMRGAVEKPLDGPGNSGFVALARFQQPKPFETRHLPRFDLDGDQQTTASAPFSTGVFPCTLSAAPLIRAGHAQ
jgi:hypothetical protein